MFVCLFIRMHVTRVNYKMASDGSTALGTTGVPGKKVLDVWDYYQKIDNRKKPCVTVVCSKEFAYLGGTTNLRNYLMSKHWRQYKPDVEASTIESRKKSTMDDFVRPAKCSDTRAKCITDRVTQMLVTDLRQIRTAECNGFRSLMKYLEPGYSLPCRKQLQHATCKQRLKEKLGEEAVFLSLTTDIWTSTATESYVTITAHYIDESWVLQAYVLETLPFPEWHTGVKAEESGGRVGR